MVRFAARHAIVVFDIAVDLADFIHPDLFVVSGSNTGGALSQSVANEISVTGFASDIFVGDPFLIVNSGIDFFRTGGIAPPGDVTGLLV